ncbi:cation-transporting P-type ATPase, partial [Streptomyces sp. NPDC058650]|uniref:cation-transporting P-type ATPase n=1 Tax=Streptomyces sp. NPDC058650 TaxID=3346575 RepID=UPI00365AB06C
MTIEAQHISPEEHAVEWWALAPADVVVQAKTEASRGLTAAEAERRLAEAGPNALQ